MTCCYQVENAINGLLAGQLTQLEDAELLDELDSIMSGLGIDTDEGVDNSKTKTSAERTPQLPEVPTTVLLPQAPSTPIESHSPNKDKKKKENEERTAALA